MTWSSVTIDVERRSNRENTSVENTAGNERRWRRLTEADRQIEAVADQVRNAVPGFDAKLHWRILQEEFAQLRRQDDTREQRIDIDSQLAADRLARFRNLHCRLGNSRKVLGNPFLKGASLLGEFDSAARAVNQSGAEARFKLSDRFADA